MKGSLALLSPGQTLTQTAAAFCTNSYPVPSVECQGKLAQVGHVEQKGLTFILQETRSYLKALLSRRMQQSELRMERELS